VPLVERHMKPLVLEALAESRAVCILGARQVGKSTLARQIADSERPASYLTLDDEATRRAALEDPTGFVALISGPVVIDEIQRAPDLMLAIKMRLDTDDTRGQFLLTGSADVLALPSIADALPGRVEYLRLWPFSQGELAGVREGFLDRLFAGEPPHVENAELGRIPYAHNVAAGGFPDAQGRSERGRSRFFASYLATILERGLDGVARLRDRSDLSRLLNAAAIRSASLMSSRSMATDLGVTHKTVAAHIKVLENLFLVRRLQPWHVNLASRQAKTPKLHISDSGLLTHLLNASPQRLAHDARLAGPVFESSVAMELQRQREWSKHEPSLFHYRDGQGREVDIVLELRSGETVGVEVKTAATVHRGDFGGLRHLRDQLGERFRAGVVLYTGQRTLAFGDRLTAVPLCGLWGG
jgi:uncharacterized protein